MKEQTMKKEPMLMTLCCRCAAQYYSTNCYRMVRTDPYQIQREECTFCGYRQGYDYYVYPKKNRIVSLSRKRPVRIMGGRKVCCVRTTC